MYQQREEPETLEVEGLWAPEILRTDGEPLDLSPEADDAYAVVDEIISDDVRLAVAPWPSVDSGGRLRFGESGSAPFVYPRDALQILLDTKRADERQLPRPIRIGDVFLIRGFGELDSWQRVLDVTAPSRRAARRAGLRAVAQPVHAGPVEGTTEAGTLAAADEQTVPSWRRPPSSLDAMKEAGPPPEPTPGSAANAAV